MRYKIALTMEAEKQLLQWKNPGRRINKQDRIIYSIHEEVVTVNVISIKNHYKDK